MGLDTIDRAIGATVEFDQTEVDGPRVFEGERGLCHALQLSYWTRHWIFQEVILSPSPVLMYGAATFDYKNLHRFCSAELDRGYNIRSSLYSLIHVQTPGELVVNAAHRWYFIQLHAQSSVCCDPRDKGYGSQSLLDSTLRISVKYRQSVRSVFMRAAETWYRQQVTKSHEDFLWGVFMLASGMGLLTRRAVNPSNVFYHLCQQCRRHTKEAHHHDTDLDNTHWNEMRYVLIRYLLGDRLRSLLVYPWRHRIFGSRGESQRQASPERSGSSRDLSLLRELL